MHQPLANEICKTVSIAQQSNKQQTTQQANKPIIKMLIQGPECRIFIFL
jgi:hypothetical protein